MRIERGTFVPVGEYFKATPQRFQCTLLHMWKKGQSMGRNSYRGTKPWMSSFLVLNRVDRIEIQSVMLVFSTTLVNYCPSDFLTGLSPPLFPVRISSIYRSYTLFTIWPDSEPTKLLYLPKQKPWRGGGLRQINTWYQVPLLVNF